MSEGILRTDHLPPCPFCGNHPKTTTDDRGERRVFCPSCMWKGLGESEWRSLAYGDEELRLIRNALVQVLPLASAYANVRPTKENNTRVAYASGLLFKTGVYGRLEIIDHRAIAEAELRGFRTAIERAALHCCEKCGLQQTAISSMPK